MPTQIGHLNELAVTMSTTVRFLARVKSHVGLEVMISGETFVTDLTFEGFLARVRTFVILQDVLVAKASVAGLAGEDFVLAVVVVTLAR